MGSFGSGLARELPTMSTKTFLYACDGELGGMRFTALQDYRLDLDNSKEDAGTPASPASLTWHRPDPLADIFEASGA